MPENKMTDHNGFPIDAIPPRLGELCPVSAYKSAPTQIILGPHPVTGQYHTVISRRIASGLNPDWKAKIPKPKKKKGDKATEGALGDLIGKPPQADEIEVAQYVPYTFATKPGESGSIPLPPPDDSRYNDDDMGELYEIASRRTRK